MTEEINLAETMIAIAIIIVISYLVIRYEIKRKRK